MVVGYFDALFINAGNEIVSVAATHHSLFLAASGLLFGCGLNNHGQVGCIPLLDISSIPSSRSSLDAVSVLAPQPIVLSANSAAKSPLKEEGSVSHYSTERKLDLDINSICKDSAMLPKESSTSGYNAVLEFEVEEALRDCIDAIVLALSFCDNALEDTAKAVSSTSLGLLSKQSRDRDDVINCRVPKLRSIACGDFHSAAVTADGRLIAWGYCPRIQKANIISHNNNKVNTSTENMDEHCFSWSAAPFHHPISTVNNIVVTSQFVDEMACSGSQILFTTP